MKPTLTLLTLLALAATTYADEGSLSLSPAVVMLAGEYGQSTTQTLTLNNGTTLPFSFDLVAQDVVIREGKRVFVDAGQMAGSIAATSVFSQRHVDVRPGETVSVDVTLTLPPNAPHRAVVALFRGTNRILHDKTPMTASVGALMTFTLSDKLEMAAEPLRVRPQSAAENLSVSQLCANRGTEPFVAKGMLAVLDANGTLVGKSALAPRRLLPNEQTEIGGEYAGELPKGRYRLLVTYDYDGHTLTRSADVEIP